MHYLYTIKVCSTYYIFLCASFCEFPVNANSTNEIIHTMVFHGSSLPQTKLT